MSQLFSPVTVGPITLPNRIVVAPMCQYAADDGSATDWHLQHLMTLAMSGAGLIVLEATGVERRGRITHGCLGLYSDANERALVRAIDAARAVAVPGTRFGIQLGHAGRKASTNLPWEGRGRSLGPDEDPWQTVGASPIPFDDGWQVPQELSPGDIDHLVERFVEAAHRAVRVGLDSIELHMAHGYLMHSFLSPLSNRRDDAFGGDRDRRLAMPLMVLRAVKAAVPAHIAVGARLSGTDWVDGGQTIEDTVHYARVLHANGLDFMCVSSGGNAASAKVPLTPGYQVPLAARVKAEVPGLIVRAVGLIADPVQAETILADGHADQIALARAMLDDPRWPWHAAEKLGAEIELPVRYRRVARSAWPGAALARP